MTIGYIIGVYDIFWGIILDVVVKTHKQLFELLMNKS